MPLRKRPSSYATFQVSLHPVQRQRTCEEQSSQRDNDVITDSWESGDLAHAAKSSMTDDQPAPSEGHDAPSSSFRPATSVVSSVSDSAIQDRRSSLLSSLPRSAAQFDPSEGNCAPSSPMSPQPVDRFTSGQSDHESVPSSHHSSAAARASQAVLCESTRTRSDPQDDPQHAASAVSSDLSSPPARMEAPGTPAVHKCYHCHRKNKPCKLADKGVKCTECVVRKAKCNRNKQTPNFHRQDPGPLKRKLYIYFLKEMNPRSDSPWNPPNPSVHPREGLQCKDSELRAECEAWEEQRGANSQMAAQVDSKRKTGTIDPAVKAFEENFSNKRAGRLYCAKLLVDMMEITAKMAAVHTQITSDIKYLNALRQIAGLQDSTPEIPLPLEFPFAEVETVNNLIFGVKQEQQSDDENPSNGNDGAEE